MRSRDRHAAVLIGLTLAASAFLLGSAPRWATAVAAALGALSALPYLRSSRTLAGGPHRAPLLVLIGLAFAFTALQLVPLPAAIVDLLSPARAELAADNAAALGDDPPAFIPLTVDPPATLVELAKLAGYALFAYACLRVCAAGRRGREAVLGAAAVTAAAVAVTALGHRAAGASSLFGLYEPAYTSPSTLGPFINVNHLAAYTALGAALALGLALRRSGPARLAYLAACFASAAGALMATSRGGAVALAVGLVGAGGLSALRARRHRRARRGESRSARTKTVALGVVVLCAAAIVATLTAGPVTSQIAETATTEELRADTRFALWSAATELVRAYPITGVGRGAFVHIFPSVYEYSRLYAYLENSYYQAVVDYGIPAALALAAALAAFARAAIRRAGAERATPLELGALSGLAALAIHNVVDFNLEMPGVAMAAIAAGACLTPPALTRGARRAPPRALLLRAGAVALALAIIALAASPAGQRARAQTHLGIAEARGAEAAERAFRRHPASFMAAGELAYALYREGDPRALRAASRALFLSPEHPDLHVLTARVLAATDRPEQALVHYARALEGGAARRATIREIALRFPDPERAVRGLPLAREVFPRLAGAAHGVDSELALRYARRMERLGEPDPDALIAIAEIERDSGEGERALAAAEEAHARAPSVDTASALAETRRALGDGGGAIASLDEAAALAEDGAALAGVLLARAELEKERGDLERARASLREITEGVSPRRETARAHRALAGVESELGNRHRAEWHRGRAEALSE